MMTSFLGIAAFFLASFPFLCSRGLLLGCLPDVECYDILVELSSYLAVLFLQHLFFLYSAIGCVAKMTKCMGEAFPPGGAE